MKQRLIFVLLLTGILLGCSAHNKPEIGSLENPASDSGSFPFLDANGDSLYMSWLSPAENGHVLQIAAYADQQWSTPRTVARDSSWFVNWADFPSVIADSNGPVAVHWLNKIPGGPYAYNVNISINKSDDQWSSPFTPHMDGTATEHGFVSMIPWDEDTILAIWLDGRRTEDRSGGAYYNLNKAMTLRGALLSKDGDIEKQFLIDDAVCDCCQTSLVKTTDGAVAAYRNRAEGEIRDIYVSRFDGNEWSEPALVHEDGWKIGACPVNGPKLAAADNTVLAAWHTGANDDPAARAAISEDGGKQFGDPITLNDKESLGRVDAAVKGDKAYVSWMEKSDDKANFKLASFVKSDTTISTLNIEGINSSRQAGFPQMEIVGDEIIFAWTNIDSTDKSKVEMRKVSLPLN